MGNDSGAIFMLLIKASLITEVWEQHRRWYFYHLPFQCYSFVLAFSPCFYCKVRKVNRWIYAALYYKPFISKALRYGPCVTTRSHSFTCHPHTNHTCLYSPAARHHRPLASIIIAPTQEGIARSSWPGWLVTYRDKMSRTENCNCLLYTSDAADE